MLKAEKSKAKYEKVTNVRALTIIIVVLCGFSKFKLHTLQKNIIANVVLNSIKIIYVYKVVINVQTLNKQTHISKTDVLTVLSSVFLQ